jgi:hypothetical protein
MLFMTTVSDACLTKYQYALVGIAFFKRMQDTEQHDVCAQSYEEKEDEIRRSLCNVVTDAENLKAITIYGICTILLV